MTATAEHAVDEPIICDRGCFAKSSDPWSWMFFKACQNGGVHSGLVCQLEHFWNPEDLNVCALPLTASAVIAVRFRYP